MKRRQFVKAASFALPGWGSVLAGCSGSSSGDPAPVVPSTPPAPAPATTGVSYGALLLTRAELDQLPRALSPNGAETAGETLPAAVDNRSTGFLPTTGDQRSQNSCTAWAVGYASATFFKAKLVGHAPIQATDLASPADLYVKLLQARNYACNNGSYIGDGLNILLKDGVESLALSPYSDHACATPGSSRDFLITGFQNIAASDATSMKRELAAGKVLPFGARVYDELATWGMGPSRMGVYRVNQATGGGGHAMVVIGYDDARGAWLVQNSWGASFGDQGRFWYDYGSFQQTASEVYSIDAAAPSPTPPSPTPPGPTPPAPPPPSAAAFTQLNPMTYVDYVYGVSVLNIYFTISEPFFVEAAHVLEAGPSGSFVIGPVAVNQWTLQSFFQWVVPLPQSFPSGNYTLVFSGYSQSGVRQEIRATQAMAIRSTTRRALADHGSAPFDAKAFEPRFLRLGDTL